MEEVLPPLFSGSGIDCFATLLRTKINQMRYLVEEMKRTEGEYKNAYKYVLQKKRQDLLTLLRSFETAYLKEVDDIIPFNELF
jgi:hypothetical protein